MGEEAPIPEIDTARISLRLPPAGAAARVVRFLEANRERHARFEPPRSPRFFTEEHWRARLAQSVEEWRAGTSLRLFAFLRGEADGPVVGRISLAPIERGPFQSARLGYAVDAGHEGRGLMREALGAVAKHAFEVMGLHRLEANHDPANERSARLLRRAGFAVEGYARDYLFIGGAWRDHVLTALHDPRAAEPPP